MKKLLVLGMIIGIVTLAVSACAPAATPAPSSKESYGLVSPGIAPGAPPLALPPTGAPAATAAARQLQPTSGGALDSATSQDAAKPMIIYTTNLSLQVDNTEKAVAKITEIVSTAKGYVSNTNLSRVAADRLAGTVTLRIPAAALDSTITQIKSIGKINNEQKNSNDVTDKYVDLDARRRNLEATEKELLKLLDTVREKSNKAEDILAVYRELTSIRSQIEQIKGQQNVLENSSSLATVTVSLSQEEAPVVTPEDQWRPDVVAARAIKQLVISVQGLANVVITFVLLVLPLAVLFLLPLVVLFYLARWFYRRNRRKSKPVVTA